MKCIIGLPNIRLTDKPIYERAFELSIELDIPFADAFNAALMEANDLAERYTFDHHLDRTEGITQVDPG